MSCRRIFNPSPVKQRAHLCDERYTCTKNVNDAHMLSVTYVITYNSFIRAIHGMANKKNPTLIFSSSTSDSTAMLRRRMRVVSLVQITRAYRMWAS